MRIIVLLLSLLYTSVLSASEDCSGTWQVHVLEDAPFVRGYSSDSVWLKANVEVSSSLRPCIESLLISAKDSTQIWLLGTQGKVPLQFYNRQFIPLPLNDSRSLTLKLGPSRVTEFWIKIPQGKTLLAGSYRAALDFNLIPNRNVISTLSTTSVVNYTVQPFAALRINNDQPAWMKRGQAINQVYLGSLAKGVKRRFGVEVLGNTNVVMQIQPQNGVLKHTRGDSNIPYYLTVGGERRRSSLQPINHQLGRMTPQLPQSVPIGVEVGASGSAAAGVYREVLAISVIAMP